MRQPKTDRLTARNPRIAVSSQSGQVSRSMSPFLRLNVCPSNRGNLNFQRIGLFWHRLEPMFKHSRIPV